MIEPKTFSSTIVIDVLQRCLPNFSFSATVFLSVLFVLPIPLSCDPILQVFSLNYRAFILASFSELLELSVSFPLMPDAPPL